MVFLPANLEPSTLAQFGEKNTQVAYANHMIALTNIFLLGDGAGTAVGMNEILARIQSYQASRSKKLYNLFVICGEAYDKGRCFVPRSRALTEYIDDELQSQFTTLNDSIIAWIKTLPSLFMGEIDWGDEEQKAYFGFVTDVITQGNDIRVEFQKLCAFPLHSIWRIHRELALYGGYGISELYRTHWAIKQVDLINELKIAGLIGSNVILTI